MALMQCSGWHDFHSGLVCLLSYDELRYQPTKLVAPRWITHAGHPACEQVPASALWPRRSIHSWTSKTQPVRFAVKFRASHHHTAVAGYSGPELGSLLSDGTSDGTALHFTLWIDDDSSVVFEVEVDTIQPSPRFRLSDDDCGHD